jgi:DNA-binding MarR family transcriptional regulator
MTDKLDSLEDEVADTSTAQSSEAPTDRGPDESSEPAADGHASARRFEDRYGAPIVSRGIATFPALILRWQNALGLTDGEVVTLAHFLSYYLTRNDWPSVSIDAVADARDVHRSVVEREIRSLESKGYVAKAGKDTTHRTFRYDLSGLFTRLEELVSVEEKLAANRKEAALIRGAARKPGRARQEDIKTSGEADGEGDRGPNRGRARGQSQRTLVKDSTESDAEDSTESSYRETKVEGHSYLDTTPNGAHGRAAAAASNS